MLKELISVVILLPCNLSLASKQLDTLLLLTSEFAT